MHQIPALQVGEDRTGEKQTPRSSADAVTAFMTYNFPDQVWLRKNQLKRNVHYSRYQETGGRCQEAEVTASSGSSARPKLDEKQKEAGGPQRCWQHSLSSNALTPPCLLQFLLHREEQRSPQSMAETSYAAATPASFSACSSAAASRQKSSQLWGVPGSRLWEHWKQTQIKGKNHAVYTAGILPSPFKKKWAHRF